MCQFCSPLCDKCRPKFMTCSQCGGRAFIAFEKCPTCGYVATEDERNQARQIWRDEHPNVAPQNAR